MQIYLEETDLIDYNNPNFDVFFNKFICPDDSTLKIVALYEFVRDAFLYDPYHLELKEKSLKASLIVQKKRAWCVEKAIVLCASFRKIKIPSRLGFAIVTNHIGVEKLQHYLRRPEIVFHGFVEVYVEGKWVKCTPAFDQKICRLNNVEILEWDGKNDSIFQEFNNNKKYMSYDYLYGSFNDVPVNLMNLEMKKYYPHLFKKMEATKEFSFSHQLSKHE